MSTFNRRRFLSRAATGAGAVFAASCSSPAKPAADPVAVKMALGKPLLAAPTLFEPILDAPQCYDTPVPGRIPLRMIIRGLCAFRIRQGSVDVLLMDARKIQVTPHVGKFSVENRFAATSSSVNPVESGVVETDMEVFEPIRVWDVRGSIVTISPGVLEGAPPITVGRDGEVHPWSSLNWQLNMDDVFPGGVLRDGLDDSAAGGVVAAIIRLTHGRIESVLPGRRYGNTGIWEISQSLEAPKGTGQIWKQALSDTVLYSLDLPAGQTQVSLQRQPLRDYMPGKDDPQPSQTPIVLNGPQDDTGAISGQPLMCGVTHEPPLPDRKHMTNLDHNRVFYELYDKPPTNRPVPKLAQQWVDRGVGRESRSAYWYVTKRQNDLVHMVNVCDPNCNGAVIGGGSHRTLGTKTS